MNENANTGGFGSHLHLKSQFRAAVMSVEAQDTSQEDGAAAQGMNVHLWHADVLSAVMEVDRHTVIHKTGTCPLHQAGAYIY